MDCKENWLAADFRFLSEKIRLGLIENEKLKMIFDQDLNYYFNHYRKLVKIGEYSPANPKFNSGKILLGLGEYELKRQQLLEQRKQEYRQYLNQINSKRVQPQYEAPVGTTPSENYGHAPSMVAPTAFNSPTYPPLHQPPPSLPPPPMIMYEQPPLPPPPPQVQYPPMSYLPPIPNYETLVYAYPPPSHPMVTEQQQQQQQPPPPTVQVNNIFSGPKRRESIAAPPTVVTEVEPTPRERKIAALQDSGLFQGPERRLSSHNIDQFQPSLNNETFINQKKMERHLCYKADLQKQIDEKKQLEREQKERERLEEQAMQAKIEKQLHLMQMEYEKEERRRKEKQELMFRRTDHFLKSQEEFKKQVQKRPSLSLPPSTRQSTESPGDVGVGVAVAVEETAAVEKSSRASSPPIPTLVPEHRRLYQSAAELNTPAQVVRGDQEQEGSLKSARSLVSRSRVTSRARSNPPGRGLPPRDPTQQITTAKFSPSSSQIYQQGMKAVLSDGDRNILTQLGSFRKHLEMEQQRMQHQLYNSNSS